jgi:hypothetical protein
VRRHSARRERSRIKAEGSWDLNLGSDELLLKLNIAMTKQLMTVANFLMELAITDDGYAKLVRSHGEPRAIRRVCDSLQEYGELAGRLGWNEQADAARSLCHSWRTSPPAKSTVVVELESLLRSNELFFPSTAQREHHEQEYRREIELSAKMTALLSAIGIPDGLLERAVIRTENNPLVESELMHQLSAYLDGLTTKRASMLEEARKIVEAHMDSLHDLAAIWDDAKDSAIALKAAAEVIALCREAKDRLGPSFGLDVVKV